VDTVKPLNLATLNFGVWVNLIILDPVISAFLLPATLKCYCIQIFANLPGSRNSRNKGHAKKNGFYSNLSVAIQVTVNILDLIRLVFLEDKWLSFVRSGEETEQETADTKTQEIKDSTSDRWMILFIWYP